MSPSDLAARNRRRAVALVAGFAVVTALVLMAVLGLLGLGFAGVVAAVVVAAGITLLACWRADAVTLAVSRAQPADSEDHARLHNLVEGLCVAGGVPKPSVYVIDDAAPNAFATGRSPRHASIAVTTGLLATMDRVELEGVLAHELSHIKNDDILVSTLAVTTVGLPVLVADLLIRMRWWNGGRRGHDDPERTGPLAFLSSLGVALLTLSPLLGRLRRTVVDDRREPVADVSGIELTRYPPGLMAALEKLERQSTVVHAATRATAHLWLAAPLALDESEGRFWKANRSFDAHPLLEDRIAVLGEL